MTTKGNYLNHNFRFYELLHILLLIYMHLQKHTLTHTHTHTHIYIYIYIYKHSQLGSVSFFSTSTIFPKVYKACRVKDLARLTHIFVGYLNIVLSFSLTSCPTKTRESRLSYYIPIVWQGIEKRYINALPKNISMNWKAKKPHQQWAYKMV